jgi:Short C-terminal domain
MRRLYSLLIGWCVLVLAPGVFELSGNVTLNGSLALVWIIGYLAQFGIFLWIMNLVPEQKILWWFIASLLPWAVDWSVPSSPWFLLLGAVVAGAVAVWIGRFTRQVKSLQEQGIRATGVVLEVLKPWMNVVINNVYIQRRLRLRIQRQDGMPAYEGILKGLFMLGEIPSVGEHIALRVDPAHPQHFDFDKAAAASAGATATFSPAEPFDSGPSAEPSDSGHTDLAGELARLAGLRERGLLSESEFAAAKKKILR